MGRRFDRIRMSCCYAAVYVLGAWPLAAWSQVPSPANSTVPTYFRLVGHDGNGVVDPAGRFVVVIRDLANNPMPNSVVRVEIRASDLRIASTPALPGLHVDCATRSVWGLTDAQGRVEFAIFGHADNLLGASPGAAAGGAHVSHYLPGQSCCGPGAIPLAYPTVTAMDHDGDGLDVGDIVTFLADLGTGTFFGRSDHDHMGTVSVSDLALLLQSYGAGRSTVGMQGLSAGGVCP